MVWGKGKKKDKKPVEVAEPAADVAAPAVTPAVEEPVAVVEVSVPEVAPVVEEAALLERFKVAVEEATSQRVRESRSRDPRAGLREKIKKR